MPEVRTYVPNALVLPENSDIIRDVPNLKLSIRPSEPVTPAEMEGYDFRTIFYDVFYENGDGQLMAIGPPLLNLERRLLPMIVTIRTADGAILKHVRYRVRNFAGSVIYRFDYRLSRTGASQVRFEFSNGLMKDFVLVTLIEKNAFLTLSCLQRNNQPVWIRDWVEYWHKLGVDRVVIYDNGSDNVDEVLEFLGDSPALRAITVVKWPYPFGIVRSFANRWAQLGQLVHAQRFHSKSRWLCSFDIDEYAALDASIESIPEVLEKLPPWIGLLKMRPHSVPHVLGNSLGKDSLPSVRSYSYRSRKAGNATKYFVRSSALRGIRDIHSASVRPRRTMIADPRMMSFFHYGGLTTGWKYRQRLNPREIDHALLVSRVRGSSSIS